MKKLMVLVLACCLFWPSWVGAQKKFTDLTEDTAPATNDWIPTVDVSDTTMAVTGTDKKVTLANLLGGHLSGLRSMADPAADRLIFWNNSSNQLEAYVPTAWRLVYFGASSALAEVAFGAVGSVLQSGGAAAGPTWTSTLTFTELTIPNAADPDLATDYDIAWDSDDEWLRVRDSADNQVAVAMKHEYLSFTINKPLNLTDAVTFPLWTNHTGAVFNIVAAYSKSSSDDMHYTLKIAAANDFTTLTTVKAITIASNGTGVYYDESLAATMTDTTVASGQTLIYCHHCGTGTDDPSWISIVVKGWYDGNVD